MAKTRTIKPVYERGDVVYVVSDKYQQKGQVLGYLLESGIRYKVGWGDSMAFDFFYAFELSETKGEVPKKEEDPEEDEEE
jgi:hypothetical protein